MSAIIEFSIFPVDKGDGLSPYVARAVRIVKESGLPHSFGPMGTSVEGEFDEVMAVVKACYEELSTDCGRIILNLKMDYRAGA